MQTYWRILSRRNHDIDLVKPDFAEATSWRISPSRIFWGHCHAEASLLRSEGGDDVPKFEPVRMFSFHRVDKIVRNLQRIYKENLSYFDIPEFAQKIY